MLTRQIATYVTPAEKASFQDEARLAGLSLASWMRSALLEALQRSA